MINQAKQALKSEKQFTFMKLGSHTPNPRQLFHDIRGVIGKFVD
jgi:hypothetical protein